MKNNIRVFVMILSAAAVAAHAVAEQKGGLPLPDSGNVTLPLDEYNRLVELASKPARKPETPPLNYSIKRADLKLRVESESVLGSVQLEGEVFKKGVAKVPLTSGITILDAKQENKALPLQQENGTQTAVLTGPSEFSITLNAGLPLGIEAGRASFSLPVPAAGSVQLSLLLPGENTYANINPGLITDRRSEHGHTAIEATLVPGQPATIWWAKRETTTPAVPREVRFLSEVKTLVSVSEAELRIATLADVTVVQGEPSQFEVEVPEGYEITGATGASLESSETQSGVFDLEGPHRQPARPSVLDFNGAHDRRLKSKRSVSQLQECPAGDGGGSDRRGGDDGAYGNGRRRSQAHGCEGDQSLLALAGALSAAGGISVPPAAKRDAQSSAGVDAISRQQRACRRCRKCGGYNARDFGRQVAHRSKTHRQEPGATFFESRASRRNEHSVGRRWWREGQASTRTGWKPRTVVAAWLPAH